ncbi:MAG: hypothetical protein Q7T19_09080 [Caulobacter sp.]|nr:hypothetical protein [Caulobacter sp.]
MAAEEAGKDRRVDIAEGQGDVAEPGVRMTDEPTGQGDAGLLDQTAERPTLQGEAALERAGRHPKLGRHASLAPPAIAEAAPDTVPRPIRQTDRRRSHPPGQVIEEQLVEREIGVGHGPFQQLGPEDHRHGFLAEQDRCAEKGLVRRRGPGTTAGEVDGVRRPVRPGQAAKQHDRRAGQMIELLFEGGRIGQHHLADQHRLVPVAFDARPDAAILQMGQQTQELRQRVADARRAGEQGRQIAERVHRPAPGQRQAEVLAPGQSGRETQRRLKGVRVQAVLLRIGRVEADRRHDGRGIVAELGDESGDRAERGAAGAKTHGAKSQIDPRDRGQDYRRKRPGQTGSIGGAP